MARSGDNALVPVIGKYPQTTAPTFGTDLTELANDIATLFANSVATVDDLPASGSYVGQLKFVTGTGRVAIWDGTGWPEIGGSTSVNVTTFGSSKYSVVSGYGLRVVRTGKRREIIGLVLRVDASAAIGNICTVDTADRPSTNVMLNSTTDSSGVTGQLYISAAGVIGVPSGYGNIGPTANKPMSGVWYVD